MRMPQVDKEIADVRATIQKVRKLLYKFHRTVENVSGQVAEPLTKFDAAMSDARQEVGKVRDDVLAIAGEFPSNYTYWAIFVLVEVLFVALLLLLVYKIMDTLAEILRRSKHGKLNNSSGAEFFVDEDRNWPRRRKSEEPDEVNYWQKFKEFCFTFRQRKSSVCHSQDLDEIFREEPLPAEPMPSAPIQSTIIIKPRSILRRTPVESPSPAAATSIRRPFPRVIEGTNERGPILSPERQQPQQPLLWTEEECC